MTHGRASSMAAKRGPDQTPRYLAELSDGRARRATHHSEGPMAEMAADRCPPSEERGAADGGSSWRAMAAGVQTDHRGLSVAGAGGGPSGRGSFFSAPDPERKPRLRPPRSRFPVGTSVRTELPTRLPLSSFSRALPVERAERQAGRIDPMAGLAALPQDSRVLSLEELCRTPRA